MNSRWRWDAKHISWSADFTSQRTGTVRMKTASLECKFSANIFMQFSDNNDVLFITWEVVKFELLLLLASMPLRQTWCIEHNAQHADDPWMHINAKISYFHFHLRTRFQFRKCLFALRPLPVIWLNWKEKKNIKFHFNQTTNLCFSCRSLAVVGLFGFRLFTLSSVERVEEIFCSNYENTKIAERLFSSSLVAVVTATEPNKLKVSGSFAGDASQYWIPKWVLSHSRFGTTRRARRYATSRIPATSYRWDWTVSDWWYVCVTVFTCITSAICVSWTRYGTSPQMTVDFAVYPWIRIWRSLFRTNRVNCKYTMRPICRSRSKSKPMTRRCRRSIFHRMDHCWQRLLKKVFTF